MCSYSRVGTRGQPARRSHSRRRRPGGDSLSTGAATPRWFGGAIGSVTTALLVRQHVPVPIWQVCFPFRKVAFRPLDLLKMDLMAVVGGAAILGQVATFRTPPTLRHVLNYPPSPNSPMPHPVAAVS